MYRLARSAPLAVAAAVAAGVLLAGCTSAEPAEALDPDVVNLQAGAPGEPNVTLTAAPPEEDVFAGSPFSEADVAFMRDMQVHHEQALAMTALVEDRTDHEDLRLFVQRMDISQSGELEQLERLLAEHEEAQERSGTAHDDHGGHADGHAGMQMPGMLSEAEMAALEAATGDEFVRLFLQGMSRHHEGALVMVESLLSTDGAATDPRLFEFAQHVDSDQRIEIDRMARMWAELGS